MSAAIANLKFLLNFRDRVFSLPPHSTPKKIANLRELFTKIISNGVDNYKIYARVDIWRQLTCNKRLFGRDANASVSTFLVKIVRENCEFLLVFCVDPATPEIIDVFSIFTKKSYKRG